MSFLLNCCHLQWGLPNGNTTWAADAITPLAPLAVAEKSFVQWNSGWFYFKYPIGHHLVLLAAYTPYLSALYLTGQFSKPTRKYPYGFSDPERALMVLAMIGRVLSVVMATATVGVVYALGAQLLDVTVGVWAAAAAACSLGMIFYAHTTNLDVPVAFWMLLALLFGLRLAAAGRVRDAFGLGVAAAMALATKEFALGILVALPLVIAEGVVRHIQPPATQALVRIVRRLALSAIVGLLTYLVATNGFYNPAGLFNRWRFLTNTLPKEFYGTLVPRPSMINPAPSLVTHLRFLRELRVVLVDAVGLSLFTAALGGVVIALVTAPRVARLLLLVFVTYYWFALVPVPLVTLRYVLPFSMLLMLFAGLLLSRLACLSRTAAAAVLVGGLAYGAGVDHLLLRDPRYAAEDWLRQHAAGHTVEVYNRTTFLPRFPHEVKRSAPKLSEITQAAVQARRPDFILLSLPDINRVTSTVDTYEAVTKRRPENEAFVKALLSGRLRYRLVARFLTYSPLIRSGVIRSLNPEIVVFERS